MRYLVIIIIVLLLAYAWWPQQEPPPIEETFIGDQIVPLRKAQQFEQKDYLEGLEQHRKQLDAQEAADGS